LPAKEGTSLDNFDPKSVLLMFAPTLVKLNIEVPAALLGNVSTASSTKLGTLVVFPNLTTLWP
jgi:hypothetical protein